MAGSLQMLFTGFLLLLGLCRGVSPVDDFTCVTKPRIDTESEDTYIAGYFVDGNGSVFFNRTVMTSTGYGLPPGYSVSQSELPQEEGRVAIMWMPARGGVARIGTFSCQTTTSDNDFLSMGTVIMSKTADFLPARVSRTVNLGDAVHLNVITRNTSRVKTRWRKNGADPTKWFNGHFDLEFSNATEADGGIYEVHQAEKRAEGQQALMRLIVRGCEQNKWNAPSCKSDCPVCFNGGVCDDKSGDCICPPGFGGGLCETPYGPNRFGQRGSLRCDGHGLGDVPTCEGKLFCLPDPYGCSCAAGYKGIDCDETCDDGSFGADCSQTCHCIDGAICNKTTGECPGGQCVAGFTGSNCQDDCLTYNGVPSCNTTCTLQIDYVPAVRFNVHLTHANFSWDAIRCSDEKNVFNYVYELLTGDDKVGRHVNQTGRVEGTTLSLKNLVPCGTRYRLAVAAETSKGIGPYGYKEFTTPTTVPGPVDGVTIQPTGHDELRVSWRASETTATNPCGATNYTVTYKPINLEQCEEGLQYIGSKNITETMVVLSGLRAYSTYRVDVTPRNKAGNGIATSAENTTLERKPKVAPEFNSSLSTTNSITLSWNRIPCGSRGGNITRYESRIFRAGESRSFKVVASTTEVVTFDALSPCTSYIIRTKAGNDAGYSKPLTLNTITEINVPDSVQNLRLRAANHNKLVVSWTPPGRNQNNPCSATDYIVTYDLVNLEQCEEIHQYGGIRSTADNTLPLVGLRAYSTYRVNVTPRNRAGNGTATSEEWTTFETKPTGAPVLRNSSTSHNNITFSWDPPPCGNRGGEIRRYRYNFWRSGQPRIIVDKVTLDKFVRFDNLMPCTSYSFKVRAYAGKGQGPWTSETQQDTVMIDGITSLVLRPSRDAIRALWMTAGDEDSPCPETTYLVTHALLNTEQCNKHVPPIVEKSVTVNTTSATIGSLRPYSTYRVHVVPEDNAATEFMKTEDITTEEAVPNAAPTLKNNVASNESITFSWAPIECGRRGGNITHYEYTFRKTKKERLIRNKNTTIRSVTFDDLSPCTSYSFKVRAHTVIGAGPWTSETQQEMLLIDEMQNLTLKSSTNEISASWTSTGNKEKPCPATRYLVSYELINMEQCDPKPNPVPTYAGIVSKNNIVIHSLYAHSTYRVRVVIEKGTRNNSMKTEERMTLEGVPLAAPELDEVSRTSTSVTIFWRPIPCGKRGGNITGYLFKFHEASGKLLEFGSTTAESVAFKSLSQGAPYSLRLRAYTNVGPGPWLTVNVKLKLDKGNTESEGLLGNSATLLIIGAAVCLLLSAAVSLPIAILMRRRQQPMENSNADNTEACRYADVGFYEEIKLKHVPSTSGHDPPAISSISASTNDPAKLLDSTKPSTSTKVPVKSKHYVRTYKPPLKASTKSRPAFPQTGPVAMAHLDQYIESRKSRKFSGFQQDFKSLPRGPLYPWTVARKEQNKKKNRSHNILAYDHSRVVLETLEDNPHSDYINASYINRYKQESRYIACQGPTGASVDDMWRMVWQERVGKIVMLTNLVESGKGKCDKYWPDVRSNYGDISVTNVKETEHCNFTVRAFHLSKNSEPTGEHHVVMQFHYTTWPDMKLPESTPLLQFLHMVKTYEISQHGPIVVHCSTGVGRTGTFIALDAMLEQAQAEGQVDVLSFVRDMREQRFLMVETLDQYKFIFDALLESMPVNTAIPADRFKHDYAKLIEHNKKTGTNGIEDQFKILEIFTALSSNELCTGGRDLANKDKNRFEDCLPRDSTRPFLKTAGKERSTDYINATFLEGYKDKNAYIVTQAPLPNTVGDIWRMVFDYKSTCIVMLNSMDSDPSVAKYWPEKGSLCCGPLTVKFKSEDRRTDNLIFRQFGIYFPLETCDEVHSVCHIQYLGWPTGRDVPDSPSSLLEVLEAVRTWTNDHPDGPVTVHCIDGVGCSGTFCAIITLLDCLHDEKVVDVFQAVKKLRTIRAGMVETLDQYKFCYQVMQIYLDSRNIYENLK